MRISIVLIYSLWFCFIFERANSQDQEIGALYQDEIKIQELFEFSTNSKEDREKDEINNDIAEKFTDVLKLKGSFDYPFDSLKQVGKITSSDNHLRVYTWNVPYNDGTNKYFGFIQFIPEKEKQPLLFRLIDKSDEIKDPEYQELSKNNWFGALYYSIVTVKSQDTKYYTLLGFDFNDLFSSKKIIDVLYFNDANEPVFGKPIFQLDKKLMDRVIFEYAAQAAMSLKYNKDKDMIVFDHLSPSKPSFAGKFQYYGPDMSYDGLKFENGIWVLKKDLDMRN